MNSRTITFQIERYRYIDRRLEDLIFEVTATIHGNQRHPFTVDSVVPASDHDKQQLLNIESQENISGWYDDLLSDLQSDLYVAWEELDQGMDVGIPYDPSTHLITKEESEWVKNYVHEYDPPEPKVLELEDS